MGFLRRFGYYLVGIVFGSIVVYAIWGGKGATFDYLPNARTLKQLRIRKRVISEGAKQTMLQHNIDSAQISGILKHGDVNFSKSKARKKPCAEYLVTSDKFDVYVVRCDSTATIKQVLPK